MNDRPVVRRPRLTVPRRLRLVVLFAALAVVGAACSGAAGPASSPGASTIPVSPTPATFPITQADAIAKVLAQQPRFAGIGPLDPNLIGQSAWYEVSPATVGWRVAVTVGWGDCQAGCISKHVWTYAVAPDGTVSLVSETGDEPLPSPVPVPGIGHPGIAGTAHKGPVCPVVKDPPDPSCADRPVAGAVVVVRDASGKEVARATTGADGTFVIDLEAGIYTVEAQPVDGLMGTPAAVTVTVPAGAVDATIVDLAYDTGIR